MDEKTHPGTFHTLLLVLAKENLSLQIIFSIKGKSGGENSGVAHQGADHIARQQRPEAVCPHTQQQTAYVVSSNLAKGVKILPGSRTKHLSQQIKNLNGVYQAVLGILLLCTNFQDTVNAVFNFLWPFDVIVPEWCKSNWASIH